MLAVLKIAAPVSGVASALTLPVRLAGGAAGALAGAIALGAGPVLGRRPERQVWSRPGRAHLAVDLRGLLARGLGDELAARAGAMEGVEWCYLDESSGRLVVEYDDERIDADQLTEATAEAETELLARTAQESEGETAAEPLLDFRDDLVLEHPADVRPLTTAVTGLAVSSVGAVAAAAGRLAHLPALPTSATALVALVDSQPRLRRLVESRIGRASTDTALGAANAAVQGLAQGTLSLAVDIALRTGEVLELQARRAVWESREAELYVAAPAAGASLVAAPSDPDDAGRGPRRELPPGPVERYAERLAEGGLVAAGATLVATGSLDRAGQALLVAVPRAALAAREGFASALTRGLAGHGVVPFAREAYRRLDRVDTVIVDAGVLRGERRLVLGAEPAIDAWSRDELWSAVQRLLWHEGPLPIPPPRGRSLDRLELRRQASSSASEEYDLLEGGGLVGRALVGWELDPYAAALVAAARAAGLRLVVTDDPNLGPLADAADELLPAGTALSQAVRAAQAQGRVVALVSGRAGGALRAADVGIAVIGRGMRGRTPAADLAVGPSLDGVRRLLLATAAARRASSAGVTLAAGGAVLGGLLLVASPPGTSGSRNVLPVHLASGLAIAAGAVLGHRAAGLSPAEPVAQVPWHALDPDEVLARLDAVPAQPGDPPQGRPGEAAAPVAGARRLAMQLAAELSDPLTPVLSVGAAASAILGSGTDAALVGSVMTGNALVSGAQRLRADRAIGELLLKEELPARRLGSDGSPRLVRASALRPGHVVELLAGDVVPADARLLAVEGLQVDEASLTGESGGVQKEVRATPGADLPERACMVYEGTAVLSGRGRAVVVAVGGATEAGRAVSLAGQGPPPSGLQVRLQDLTRKVLPVTLVGGGLVSGLSLLRGQPSREALASGVAMSVAAVPEGLPLVATVAQLAAARRLSRRGVLVRSSRTVEALGRVDTVCFDKTGTLTHGRLRLVRIADLDGEWAPSDPAAHRLLTAAALSSPRSAEPVLHATDQAVLDAARAHLAAPPDSTWDDLSELPFDSSRGYSAALGRLNRRTQLVVKGAPEVVLPRCSRVATGGDDADGLPLSEPMQRDVHGKARDVVERLARDGLRVLAVAYRPLPSPEAAGSAAAGLPDAVEELTLLGFVALADSPRTEAADAIRGLRAAGLSVLMITGDHPVTARAVAEQIGLGDAGRLTVLTGRDLEGLDEASRVRAVSAAQVFARITPEQKVRIVEALRAAGRVVAMTGDGTNDAAAIRLADVGIGLGMAGSTAARRAGDLVLTRPDVGLVLVALEEGRAMWARARDAVAVLVGGNLGEVAFTVLGTALAGRAPIGTRQFLLVNLLTDLFPAMAIAVAADRGPAENLPPVSGQSALLRSIAVRGTATAAAATAAWTIGRATGLPRRASTMGLAALVGAQLGQTLVVAHRDPGVVGTAVASAAALVTIVSVPGLSHFFGCTPLGPVAWTTVATCATGATLGSVVVPRLWPHLAPRETSPVMERLEALIEAGASEAT